MRITLVLENIRGGGAPFSAVNWANAWQRRGHQVSIVVVHPNEGQGADFALGEGVTLTRIDVQDRAVSSRFGALRRLWNCLSLLRGTIRATKPEVVLSFAAPINVRMLMACIGLPFHRIVMEQTHPGMESHGKFWEKWRKRLYPRASALVNLTRDAHDWCQERFPVARTAVIPNPVLPPATTGQPKRRGRLVVAAGRLVEQKRFDLLIAAFAMVAEESPDWNLVIYGEGADREWLESLVAGHGLAGRISLPGWAGDLSAKMAEGEFFVLSSGYEGFGNVICEAMAVGRPVVSFNCPSGPGDIIRHEVDGLLVPPLDTEGLAAGMARLMRDEALCARLGARAPEVLERFSLERTLEMWDALFERVMGEGRSR
ncbi:MAG: glycosyltransferase family 4 protein [Pseudodesulfovibrio sp.]|uniref:Glycosyl transferase group 1 n=1 Tax=Pseudodesulfovibrio aespoeensis (strain ATCC 700646 / DSM 10631 / Aspo-2) TaxID=643562 RepID=E6VZL4_PSEA9|nr:MULTISPECIES: glycosyltransferase family 4 protein [Pseudodesulfovibrio]MBU4379825.1 glycosyltransferase family 4 protein [Pseudomonadota bacterium]ADU61728.1 glycosyl transferase group 1 [Pseudodesulfovibrio aespoeensis Aspo-2]MBU4475999.1 glycosyltransferase family 4 protein [Pseudomonadota bacterium]MBU4515772.1 glycosyltransferase family 4 protein [Pseudomonadota bacterium]MBU4520762.1 glycosyltransferase family 4 protein [Pseudomonadota bacterium]